MLGMVQSILLQSILPSLLILSALAAAEPVRYTALESLSKWETFVLTLVREPDECRVISFTDTQRHRHLLDDEDVVVETKFIQAGSPVTEKQIQLFGHFVDNIWMQARDLCPSLSVDQKPVTEPLRHSSSQHAFLTGLSIKDLPPLEVYPLVVSGPPGNRIDLTFFSDGYKIDEKDKFLADAKRLALDMSQNQTFASVQPLINFWAAFSPSEESGIGNAGKPKDTTYGLYRDGTELRAVYCSKKKIAREACLSLHSQCDYPILLGNDPLYGGLGGEFTISTASEINGALVLRHELGHSIIEIGEEYDGGFAYFGVNAISNISKDSGFKWSHWLSSPISSGELPRKERSVMPFQAYPWTILNKTASWSATFSSSGLYSRHRVRFSLSGIPAAEDLTVYLDGEDLGWTPRPDVSLDRWHYDIYREQGLAAGPHDLNFTLGESALEGTAQLCSAEIIEYGDEEDSRFNSTVGYYGAFPTFSYRNETTFRPTNEQCLMRIVTSPSFCKVCLEGLWLSLLKRVSLIDDMSVTFPVRDSTPEEPVVFEVTLIPFGERRSLATRHSEEAYTIQWERDGVPLTRFANMTRIELKNNADVFGDWFVSVRLKTPDVKLDPKNLLESHIEVHVYPGDISWLKT